jgi:hypothetical protein
MEPSSKLWNRINKFLENHTFQMEWNFPGSTEPKVKTNFKIELTGTKIYTQVIEREYIEYTLYILPSQGISDIFFSAIKKIIKNDTEDVPKNYSYITRKSNELLTESLLYFGIEQRVICNKVINLVEDNED